MHPLLQQAFRHLARVPVAYALLAFLTARRIAVRGWSMYPALAPGERVLFDALAYRLAPPRSGDLVLALHPARPRLRLLKRVAAVPGDIVAVRDGRCWVNGRPTGSAPYEPDGGAPAGTVLGRDEYFLLGDAAHRSTDAREFGAVARSAILARAWLVYWPPGKVRRVS